MAKICQSSTRGETWYSPLNTALIAQRSQLRLSIITNKGFPSSILVRNESSDLKKKIENKKSFFNMKKNKSAECARTKTKIGRKIIMQKSNLFYN